MGYRSEVAYLIRFAKQDDFIGFKTECQLSPDTQACFEDHDFEVDETELVLRMKALGVKWYTDFPDVKCHENLWDKAVERYEEHEVDVSGGFIRVGEALEDLEERWFGEDEPYDELYINRSIAVNW